jgi:hypothetical protein
LISQPKIDLIAEDYLTAEEIDPDPLQPHRPLILKKYSTAKLVYRQTGKKTHARNRR